MQADIDVEVVGFGQFLKANDKRRVVDCLRKADRFGWGAPDVV